MSAPMRVLVTRPAAQAADWVRRLAARGVDAHALPLLAIEPPADVAAVHAAWRSLVQRDWLVFVSPSAVEQFFALRPTGASWPATLGVASPGPGTTAALRAVGVPADAIVAPTPDAVRFDSESLWAAWRPRADWSGVASVLIVRGSVAGEAQGSGRDWLTQRLRELGAQVDPIAAYRRTAPSWSAPQHALWEEALAEPARHLWLFSSSDAIEQLLALARGRAPAPDWRQARAIATHERIAATARRAGFAQVLDAAPTLDALVDAVRVAGAADPGPPSIESGSP